MQQDPSAEPLKNIVLESAILGLKMALTDDEGVEARRRFLDILRDSTLAVPTITPVATAPDGSIEPGADIQLIIATNPEGISGVPAFTQLGVLRATLPQLEHGMFLSGTQLCGILANSEHRLFIDGPDLHAEVSPEEMQAVAQTAAMMAQMQQQAAGGNARLEAALATLHQTDITENRAAVVQAFLEEFSRVPIASDIDEDAECVVLSTGAPENTPETPQELELLTQDDALLCFTSEDAMKVWDNAGRNAVVLPGPVIAQLAAQAEVLQLIVNKGSKDQRLLLISGDRLDVA
ncbi:MAG: SseB family protein [Janthinobacterium lividum]